MPVGSMCYGLCILFVNDVSLKCSCVLGGVLKLLAFYISCSAAYMCVLLLFCLRCVDFGGLCFRSCFFRGVSFFVLIGSLLRVNLCFVFQLVVCLCVACAPLLYVWLCHVLLFMSFVC